MTELTAWLAGGDLPETVSSLRFDPKSLRDVTPRQRAIYRGTICLILGAGTGTRDFHTQSVITGKLMADEGIDDHHVFPDNYLKGEKGNHPAPGEGLHTQPNAHRPYYEPDDQQASPFGLHG